MKLWIDTTVHATERTKRTMEAFKRTDIKKIAVIKFAAFGDLILTRPFILEAKQFFPNAKITMIVMNNSTHGTPVELVDNVCQIYNTSCTKRKFTEAFQNIRALGKQDILFDLTASAYSRWATIKCNAKIKIGFTSAHSGVKGLRLIYNLVIPRNEYRFEADVFLDQLRVLGAKPPFKLNFGSPETDNRSKRIVYFPTASERYKSWPGQNFVKLIERLQAYLPHWEHVILSGLASWEERYAQDIFQQLDKYKTKLVKGSELTSQLLQSSKLLVSNDTGVRNLAISLSTPTVGIFFATLPFSYTPNFGKHSAVFMSEGGIPSVEMVENSAKNILEQ